MKKSALSKFQAEFRKWVLAYNSVKNVNCDPDTLLERLTDRIPEDRQIHIGAALLNGWLETEKEPIRGYFVRESDRPGNTWRTTDHNPLWQWQSCSMVGAVRSAGRLRVAPQHR